MTLYNRIFIIILFLLCLSSANLAQELKFEKISEFIATEARQGVAVDDEFIYVVGTQEIAKYDKTSYAKEKEWIGDEDGPIIHLDSGVILDDNLYCAHSNYPDVPMTSSIEIWDANTLEHVGNHSFGIRWGSCTWVDRHDGYWYAAFAHYKKWEHLTGKDAKWTTVVKFDDDWNELGAWIYPLDIVKKFDNMSNSGGSFGPDGYLYSTGHDASEVYVMDFPKQGSELVVVKILPLDIFGQGIAWDRTEDNILYGIQKKNRKVVVSKLIKE
jgi:hypothetical protein